MYSQNDGAELEVLQYSKDLKTKRREPTGTPAVLALGLEMCLADEDLGAAWFTRRLAECTGAQLKIALACLLR